MENTIFQTSLKPHKPFLYKSTRIFLGLYKHKDNENLFPFRAVTVLHLIF